MHCLKEECWGKLEYIDTDSRGEWYEQFYQCKKCGATHTRRITFKPQSCLVASDKLTLDKRRK